MLAFEKSGKKEEQETITIYNGTEIPKIEQSPSSSGSLAFASGATSGSGNLDSTMSGSGSYSGSTAQNTSSTISTSNSG